MTFPEIGKQIFPAYVLVLSIKMKKCGSKQTILVNILGGYNVWRQPKAGAYEIRELFMGKISDEPLPAMVHVPSRSPKDEVYIQAVVP